MGTKANSIGSVAGGTVSEQGGGYSLKYVKDRTGLTDTQIFDHFEGNGTPRAKELLRNWQRVEKSGRGGKKRVYAYVFRQRIPKDLLKG